MQVTTNNVPRDLISLADLSEKEREDFGYVQQPDDTYTERFFRYKGNVYDTQDCEHHAHSDIFRGWDGYYSETFFSGVVFKYAPNTDYEQVIVGRYCT